jgi:predicted lipoprotein with Yx(FWY)xxD motif
MVKLTFLVTATVGIVIAAGCSTPPQPSADVLHPMPPAFFSNGFLVSPTGRTLYTYDRDPQGASTCAGDCVQTWAPFAPAAGDAPHGDFTILARDDGGRQWAYQGRPVYLCKLDHFSGDTACDKRENAWHAVRRGM